MYTGIVQEIGTVVGTHPLKITLPSPIAIKAGSSVAIDGTCLTTLEDNALIFDVSEETARVTTLGNLKEGDRVNVERSAKFGDEIGGHIVSGHVSGKVTLLEKGDMYCFSLPEKIRPYLYYKGFVTLNGASLTVAEITENSFSIAFIPETLKRTTFGTMEVGTEVNLEWDQMSYSLIAHLKSIWKHSDENTPFSSRLLSTLPES